MAPRYRIGELYFMKFTGSGSEQQGWRPGLVFQNNVGNLYSPNIIALPLTSAKKKLSQPTHVLLAAKDTGLRKDSVVLCENPERVSKENISSYISTLSDEDMARVAAANLLATSAISFMDEKTLLRSWKRAVFLNANKEGRDRQCITQL